MIFKNIRALREDRDIKQREIAEALGVSQNTYSQYENGVIAFTDQVLLKLANYYDVSVDYLMDRTNVKDPYPNKDWKPSIARLYFFALQNKNSLLP